MSVVEWPAKLREVVDHCITHQRSFMVNPGADSGGSPYVAFVSKWDNSEIRLTWHTRDNNGRYRFFSGLAHGERGGWHDVTIKRAIEMLAATDTGGAA